MDYNYVKNDKIDIDQLSQEICELLKKGNIKSYEEFRKEQDEQAMATLESIFGIITEDELHYNTSCCGLMKYNNDTLYNQGINSKAEGIDNRYAEVRLHSPLCCGLCS